MKVDRRTFLVGSLGLAAGAATAAVLVQPKYHVRRLRPRSRVAILSADSYSEKLEKILCHGLDLFHLDIRGKSVLLKPNLVDYIPGNHINTHPLLVAAAVECFRRLGAKSVIVGEGPGHQRDTELVLFDSGFADQLRQQRIPFVDLNRDELVKTRLLATYTRMNHLWLPQAIRQSDFIVSMPKVKAHHWSGVTLSMKNMFGVVPGAKYGWPKNILHWKGIQESILDVCATVPVHFVIADAIIAMEGNGPLHGSPRPQLRLRSLQNIRFARRSWEISAEQAAVLKVLTEELQLSVAVGDLRLLDGKWYVTHAGLLRVARRNHCSGIQVQPLREFCDSAAGRWVFKATVYESPGSKGFVGYGDADPSNVSSLVHGAEMRVAETRAVNRALRKAYGIGLCSVEELGSFWPPAERVQVANRATEQRSGNGQPRLRDRLCLLIRQHQLDPTLVKLYAADYCGTAVLRDASRDLVEAFINSLAEWATKDRDGLVCHLNSYAQPKETNS